MMPRQPSHLRTVPIPQDYLLADEELDNKPLRTAEEAYIFSKGGYFVSSYFK
ncbi:hypothetical protein SOV_36790 [Sporomusa ovata DSM 2662]|uniref:Uncharacterized protein n=1 Tax=Sporomusa ovata TaxID=2378 RepID=A0A0U1L6N2_9FIRM|nr:hypothetical protein SOV_6c02420 [Sporomusa ovata DSM 2662]CQR75175.1 hypothetical protein SpAn4DRAFT_4539 [Sporomusa ovata]